MDFQYYLHTYLPTFVFLTLVKRIFSIFFGFSLVFKKKKKISCFFNLRHWNSVGVYKRIVFCLKVSLSLSEVHPYWLESWNASSRSKIYRWFSSVWILRFCNRYHDAFFWFKIIRVKKFQVFRSFGVFLWKNFSMFLLISHFLSGNFVFI